MKSLWTDKGCDKALATLNLFFHFFLYKYTDCTRNIILYCFTVYGLVVNVRIKKRVRRYKLMSTLRSAMKVN